MSDDLVRYSYSCYGSKSIICNITKKVVSLQLQIKVLNMVQT